MGNPSLPQNQSATWTTDTTFQTLINTSIPASIFHFLAKFPAAPTWPSIMLIKEGCNSSVSFCWHAERPPEQQLGTLPVLHRSQHKNIHNTKSHVPVQLPVPEYLASVKGEPPLLWKPASGPLYSILQLSAGSYGGLSYIRQE